MDFGHVTCDTCGMVYTKSQEEDEEQHAKYHQHIVRKLRFNVSRGLNLICVNHTSNSRER